ncbi:MAG: response regulator [Cyclobacteriaceae bacterium]
MIKGGRECFHIFGYMTRGLEMDIKNVLPGLRLFLSFVLIYTFQFVVAVDQMNALSPMQTLSISNGLPHNGVTSILEDSHGYMWFGTYDGVTLYDGFKFRTFKNTLDVEPIVSNRVRALAEDLNGNIWLGTDEGISLYNYETQTFSTVYTKGNGKKRSKGPIIRDIIVLNNGNVVCATEDFGILVFDSNYKLIDDVLSKDGAGNDEFKYYHGLAIDDDNLILGSSRGLVHISLKSKKVSIVYAGTVNMNKSLIKLENNQILFSKGDRGLGVIPFFIDSDGTLKFNQMMNYLNEFQFPAVSTDHLGNIWLGIVDYGLIKVSNIHSLGSLNSKHFNAEFKPDFPNIRPSIIYTSSKTGCWFGTFDLGLFRFNIEDNPFSWYKSELRYPFGITTDNVSFIAPFDDHRAIIKAIRGGISLFNTNTQSFEPFFSEIAKEKLNTASAFSLDESGNLWFFMSGEGLCLIRKGHSHYQSLTREKFPELNFYVPRSLSFDDDKGVIWMGGGDHVYRVILNLDLKVQKIETIRDNPFFKESSLDLVRVAYSDPEYDFLWFGSDVDGLFRVHLEEGVPLSQARVDQFLADKEDTRSISSNFVTSIIRDESGVLWVGTERGGICRVHSSNERPEFEILEEKHGLSNNVVKSMLLDAKGDFWVPTNIGLSKLDVETGRFRRFTASDGLPFLDFVYSSTILKNGTILLTSEHGFCLFDPDKLPKESALPNVHFNALGVLGDEIAPGDTLRNRVVIDRRLDEVESISLMYDENVFSVDVISLHYADPNNHMLRYRLKPLNNDWIITPSSQYRIYYNGLRPGEYDLEVSASNAQGLWTESKFLKIKINPPFWRTKLAYFVYSILVGLIGFVIVYFVTKIQKLRHSVEIEHLESESAKELNAAKLRFFSNISHEIKTPLTLISGPVNVLKAKFGKDPDAKEKLDIIERQSKKMSQLVDQVHDFQRSDANQLKLNFTSFDFKDFVKEVLEDFEFLAKNDGKELWLDQLDEQIQVSADREKIEKVLNNLLSNAFKFTQAGDKISVRYYSEGKDLFLHITDTGLGISNDDLPRIFERFYQTNQSVERNAAGSGIGLAFIKRLIDMHYGYVDVKSKIGEGSEFIVKLPIVTDKLTENEKETKQKIIDEESRQESYDLNKLSYDKTAIHSDAEFSELTVFLAEDNVDMRMFVSEVLSLHYKVRAFENGQECLNAMDQEWPDLILSDVMMPELDGFDLCKILKNDIKTSHIPIILLTARAHIDDEIKGLKDGADAYLKKPFDVQHLIATIDSLLRNRKQLRDRFEIDLPLELKSDTISKDSVFLEKLYSLMNENLSNGELNLDDFAKELYLNRTHFYQKVKALTNQTPFELLKGFRLKKAAEYLTKGRSVNEVYVMTGFRSRAHFSRSFKSHFDVTPGKYSDEQKSKMQLS